jgi:hypothetical protein
VLIIYTCWSQAILSRISWAFRFLFRYNRTLFNSPITCVWRQISFALQNCDIQHKLLFLYSLNLSLVGLKRWGYSSENLELMWSILITCNVPVAQCVAGIRSRDFVLPTVPTVAYHCLKVPMDTSLSSDSSCSIGSWNWVAFVVKYGL